MKIKLTILASFLITSINTYSQQIGDGYAPYLTDFTLPLNSGVYGGLYPIGSAPDTSHPWQHLFVIRHGNPNNNHQLQIGSAFATNDRLFFRKIAGELEAMNPTWIELATRGSNSFIGDQRVSGNLGIGSSDIGFQTKLHVKESGTSNSIWRGRIVASGDINAVVMGEYNGKAWLGAHNSQLTGWSDLIIQAEGGNVGIGTTNPNSKLTIRSATTGVSIHPGGNPYFGTLAFNRESGTGEIFDANGQAFQINNGGNDKNLHFQVYNGDGSLVTNEALVINGINGNIGIGTTNPTSKLTVAGNINAREVKVTVDAGADFVFQKYYTGISNLKGDYVMPTLSEVEQFTKDYNHLPNIPSAKDMKEKGVELGMMNNLLLQKIEELTLYVIEQQKEIKLLKEKINK